jgi:hypothetical protein
MPQRSTPITAAAKSHCAKPTLLEVERRRPMPAWTEVASRSESDATWMLRGALVAGTDQGSSWCG